MPLTGSSSTLRSATSGRGVGNTVFSLGRVSKFPRRLPVKAWVAEGWAGAGAALDTARGVCRQQEQQTHWLVIEQTRSFRTADSTLFCSWAVSDCMV